jgi:hypothetical protein
MSYFKNFPKTTYNNYEVADITRRLILDKIVKDSALDYMTYEVQEGERPEDVAYFYYDDASLAWLVLLSNNIIDPYTEWPKSNENLEKYIIAQYESKSGRTGREVLDWAKNKTIANNIVHYQSQYDSSVQINRASFVALGNSAIISLNNAKIGESYIINDLGNVLQSDWNTIGGSINGVYTQGSPLTIVNNPKSIDQASSAKVELPSITNPAREYYPIRAYDYEFNLNESRRQISLINKGYLSTIRDSVSEILNDG